ncbi:ribosome maturation factor RimM [Nakamurella endophytica]|uniref:Ribosome maturation factor RimM n=1 Tax=Nakamurella endophytica TaxID=1748367 RepID=A0A917SMV8_9ACTN|nr:ribosome maturation factor RimM [Nakamurella endophytica]GGL90411.1 ribosome maturation factor RimM [Nakamurella endophytica]
MTQVQVGRIGRPHGVRGEVTVTPQTDDPDTRFAAGSVLVTEPAGRGPLTVAGSRRSGGVLVVAFAGVPDRTAAEQLRGTVLTVDSDELPEPTDDDEFYDHQLVGLAVHDEAGELLGQVTGVLHPPAAPVLEVARPDGSEELVPFVRAIVPVVDLAAGRLVVTPPDGMFAR